MYETGILTVSKPLALTVSNIGLLTGNLLFQSVSSATPSVVESSAFPKFHALPIFEANCEAVFPLTSAGIGERLS